MTHLRSKKSAFIVTARPPRGSRGGGEGGEARGGDGLPVALVLHRGARARVILGHV
jgi:hypothetical protein